MHQEITKYASKYDFLPCHSLTIKKTPVAYFRIINGIYLIFIYLISVLYIDTYIYIL